MYLGRLVRIGLLATVILGCHAASAQQTPDNGLKEVQIGKSAFTLGDPIPAWVDDLPIPATNSSQPVIVRLADTQYFLGQVPEVYSRRATVINDPASLTAAGRLSISFAPEYQRIQLHAIRIHRGQEHFDRTSTSNIRFLQREQNLEHGIYSGRVTASILIDDLRVGDTIEIAYTISGENPVFGGKAFGVSPWEQGLPTAHRRVVLNYPAGRQIAWRVVGDRPAPPLVPTDTIHDGIRRITFDEQPLPGFAAEAMTAPDFFGTRFVQFSEFANWQDVVGWASALFDTAKPQGPELAEIVKRIKALPSADSRVAAALEFVQTQIRYFSVSLGESSHRPTPADEVLRRRYGDCKDKSLLLITLLREVGVESRPVLLQLGRHAGLDKTLPSPQFFDHAIVQAAVAGKQYFLDPTRLGQHAPLDKMGQPYDGTQVLVIAPDTKSVSLIPAQATDIVGDEISERASLAHFGDEGKLEVRHVWHGVAAERVRTLFEHAAHEQILKIFGNAMERRYPGARLVGEPVLRDDLANNEYSVTANYSLPKLANEVDGNWVVTFSAENLQNVAVVSPSANRTTPLVVPIFPFHGKYSFEMIFPEEVSGSLDPRAQSVSNKYVEAKVTDYFRGNVARKTVELKTLRPFVEPSDYPGYADDLRSLSKSVGGVFAINKAFVNATASAKTDLTHRLQDQRLEVIKKTTEMIGNGKLAGADLASAYCLRGSAQADLGHYDEALQDANSALRIAPTVPAPHQCRAELYFISGQFEKSVADFSNAIALGPADAGLTYRGRGISRIYAGHVEDARADFVKASELADVETRTYADMWLVATYGRLGKAIPPDLLKQAAAQAGGEWPHAGLAMMTGALSPEQMLKSLDKKQGDERQMALAEAYFYLGQHYLVTGDSKTAQSYFEKTRELGVIGYIEHNGALFELERLKKQSAAITARPATAPRAAAQ